MSSLLSAVRNAVRSGTLPDALDEEGEQASATVSATANPAAPLAEAEPTGGNMSDQQTVAGAAPAATAALANVLAAAGGKDGYTDGFTAAMDRINAVMSAEGIRGDARRMTAAHDLAKASPEMSAEAVVSFVTANVPAAEAGGEKPAPTASAANYEQQRLAAANLAMPGGVQPKAESGLSKAVSARIDALTRKA